MAAKPGATPKHLVDARKLLKSVLPENSSYQHKNTVVKWQGENDAAQSECHTDCSGLMNSLLEHSYPYFNENQFKKLFGKKRPLAEHYFQAIQDGKGFDSIAKIQEVKPGDFIAIKYGPGEKNTGHVMLVSGPPKLHPASDPKVDGTEQWELSVIDSSMSGHGKTDSRSKSDGTFYQGLGQGVFRIYAKKSGALAGYSWSISAKSEYHDAKDRPLAIGRLTMTREP